MGVVGVATDQSQGGRGRPPLRKRSCYDSIFIQLGDEILQLGVDRMRLCGYFVVVLIGVLVSIPVTAQRSKARKSRAAAPGQAEIERMTARFAPTQLRVDISRLSAGDRQALAKIIEAARILNDIFMKQYWSGNTALYARLQKDSSALGKARLHFLDQQRPLVGAGRIQGICAWCSGEETGRGEFLSGGYDKTTI